MDLFKNAEVIFKNIENKKPIVHNISNIVTVNDCRRRFPYNGG